MNINWVSLFHVLVVSALLIYVGIMKKNTPKMVFWLFLVLGIVIVLYHSYKGYNHYMEGHSIWVNFIHVIYIGPILLYIGMLGEQTPRLWFEVLLMLGFASLGYHGYYLVKKLYT